MSRPKRIYSVIDPRCECDICVGIFGPKKYSGTVYGDAFSDALATLTQKPPNIIEKMAHNAMFSALTNTVKSAFQALEGFVQSKGGIALLSSGRNSSLKNLGLLFNDEWPNASSVNSRGLAYILCLQPDDFDPRGDRNFSGYNQRTRGGILYTQPGSDWTRIGLNCWGRYSDHHWLNDWAVSYHGSSEEGTRAISQSRRFFVGERQLHQDDEDVNEMSDNRGNRCGPGVYSAKDIRIAEGYSSTRMQGKTCVLQLRIQPSKTRIPRGNQDYRIVNDPEYVRPYGICVRTSQMRRQGDQCAIS